MLRLLIQITMLFPWQHHCSGGVIGPRIRDFSAYVREGDLNVGFFFDIHNKPGCDGQPINYGTFASEMIAYAVSKVNDQTDLLPNITLGMTVLDSCRSAHRITARAVYFLKDYDQPVPPTLENYPEGMDMALPPGSGFESPRHYPVVGTIGVTYSSYAVNVAALLSAFEIPLISHGATSDALSDKNRFPYFMRLASPDRYAAEAMVDIAKHFGWSYVSVLYSEGSYGESGGKLLEKAIRRVDSGMCLAFSHRMSSDADDEEFMWVAEKLKYYRKARVIFIISDLRQQEGVFDALQKLGLGNTFLFLAGDMLFSANNVTAGAIHMGHLNVGPIPGLRDFLRPMTPWNNPGNPWLPMVWQKYFGCIWNVTAEESLQSCYNFPMPAAFYQPYGVGQRSMYDAVFVYAYALHDLISEHCPEHFQVVDKIALRDCVTGPRLISYMHDVDFEGLIGRIQFDQKGDIMGRYSLRHYKRMEDGNWNFVIAGMWEKLNNTLTFDMSMIDWSMFKATEIFLTENPGDGNYIPESVCSKPCGAHQYYIQQELPCCWECYSCRDNEIVVDSYTGCAECPEFFWPDTETKLVCEPIPPSYLHLPDGIAAGLVAVAAMGILLLLAVSAGFAFYNNHRLVRATSRELSAIILLGTLVASVSVIIFVVKPTDTSCLLRMLGFHYGVNLLYSPMMVKTVRIYRIFSAGKRSTKKPRFIGSVSQVIITLGVIILQTVVITVVELVEPIRAGMVQQVRTEKYVELVCKQGLVMFLSPMTFNLILILVCAVLGYMSRKLPENFNESWYIFISVATTLFMWVVFLPSYFSAFYAYHQMALLAFCLLLNALITLGCLYLPKLYAILFVDDDKLKVNNASNQSSKVHSLPTTMTSSSDQPTGAPVATIHE